MKFTYSWLKDYVDVKLKPEELAERLTMSGLEVTLLEKYGQDYLFQIEVTTNRPDLLSVVGIARETAALTNTKLKMPDAGYQAQDERDFPTPAIEVMDVQACPRYVGCIIEDVKVGPSPDWLKSRIESAGLRSINNIVDITNFVLLESGQPLHAFDLEKLDGKKIIVRRANKDERIVTIDGVERILEPDILVIADATRPIAIAGIMGGRDTEVSCDTKSALLESAYFDPATIRRASKKTGLCSESSYRFQRNVDWETVYTASGRAAALIMQLAQARPGKAVDKTEVKPKPRKVSLRPSRLNALLGIQVPAQEVEKILRSLGLDVVDGSADKKTFLIPSWRPDLAREVDLIEEVTRIWGYDKIPATSTTITASSRPLIPRHLRLQSIIKDILTGFGLDEVITYSLIAKEPAEKFNTKELQDIITIKNPLSPELSTLRSSLLPGVLSTARWNLNRNIDEVKIFELGPIYTSFKKGQQEEVYLGICMIGSRLNNWQDATKPQDFYGIKGILEALLDRVGIKDVNFAAAENAILDSAESANVVVSSQMLGFFGKLRKEMQGQFDIDIKKDVYVASIDVEKVIYNSSIKKTYSPIAKFPSVSRDISMIVPQELSSERIVSLIKKTGGDLTTEIGLFDQYCGKQIPKGQRSLAYRIVYQAKDRTLTDEEVNAVHAKIIKELTDNLKVKIR